MTGVEYILEGLERALELERELGTRFVELDRSLLAPPVPSRVASQLVPERQPSPARPESPVAAKHPSSSAFFDFVFLHDRALSTGGIAMMAKIIGAMGKTPETAPIVFTGELPVARYYVVLGREALRKWFPGKSAAPGQWLQDGNGRALLITYSPEYILRFGTVTPAVQKIKVEMWSNLKTVMQRIV